MDDYYNLFKLVKCVDCEQIRFTIFAQFSRPNRHMCSPNRADFDVIYCSKKCKKKVNHDRNIFFGDLDKNCSDCECFEHRGYRLARHKEFDGTFFNGINYRIGQCGKKDIPIEIEPLQPSVKFDYEDNCFQNRYKELICH